MKLDTRTLLEVQYQVARKLFNGLADKGGHLSQWIDGYRAASEVVRKELRRLYVKSKGA